MKSSIYNKIIEKRLRILENKILEHNSVDTYQFIDLDVALLMREREMYRKALQEVYLAIQLDGAFEDWESLKILAEDLEGAEQTEV